MDFFNKLGGTISSTSKDVAQKAKEVADVAKVNGDIRTLEAKINTLYATLGKAFYEANKELAEGEFSSYIQSVNECKQQMRENQVKILDIKGIRICPACGMEVAKENVFCTSCGARMKEEEGDLNGNDTTKE